MKRLFVTIVMFFALLATSNAQASLWNWSFADIEGTLMTDETGYADGTYTLDIFTVTDGGRIGLALGDYQFIEGPFTFNIVDGILNGVFEPNAGIERWRFIGPPINTPQIMCEGFTDVTCEGSLIDGDDTYTASSALTISQPAPVPVPAAAWLFMSGLLGLVYKGRKARQSVS